jgi:hypothetical protein
MKTKMVGAATAKIAIGLARSCATVGVSISAKRRAVTTIKAGRAKEKKSETDAAAIGTVELLPV